MTKRARTGAVTLIQRFGGALNLNPHFHMLFLDGVYVERPDGSLTFRWVKAPSGAELSALAGRIASRVGRFLERQGLIERDAESASPSEIALDDEPMQRLLAHSITYRVAVGPRAERKVFTLQRCPPAMKDPVRRQARSAASACMPAWLRRSPSVFPSCAVDSGPRQRIGCAQGATPSGSRRRRAGVSGAEGVAAVISRTQAGPAGLGRAGPALLLLFAGLNGDSRLEDEQGVYPAYTRSNATWLWMKPRRP
jgi:hypothetical protein